MSKDAYYFPHDSNAKDDPKCVLLIEQLGMEGYGIYWMLIETLREQPGYKYPVNLLPALARRYNTTPEKVRTVVGNYGLFIVEDDTIFFSDSLNRRMQVLAEKRLKLSEAGKRGNAARWNIATRSPGDNKAIATQSQVKKSKVNKSRENIGGKRATFSPPSLEDMVAYFMSKGYSAELARKAFDYYAAGGWKDSKGNPVKNWKQKCIAVWFKPENLNSDSNVNPQPYVRPINIM